MKKNILRVGVYLFVFIFVAFIVWCRHIFSGGPDAVILMYHSVGAPHGELTSLDVSARDFERQMDFLSRHGFRVVRLTELAAMLRRGEKIASRTVVITFDDGYENNYTEAFPVLKKYGFPATIFVVGSHLGEEYPVARRVPTRLLTLAQIKEMEGSGLVDIGSHTWTHSYLPGISDPQALRNEILGSKVKLEAALGRPVVSFCYPLGGYTRAARKMVQGAGYRVAVGINSKKGRPADDLYTLKRIKVAKKSRHMGIFFVQVSGYYLRMKESSS